MSDAAASLGFIALIRMVRAVRKPAFQQAGLHHRGYNFLDIGDTP